MITLDTSIFGYNFVVASQPFVGFGHGPKTWPWWKPASFLACKIFTFKEDSHGWRLWVYTRKTAFIFDIYFYS